jgi:hypothetical protein
MRMDDNCMRFMYSSFSRATHENSDIVRVARYHGLMLSKPFLIVILHRSLKPGWNLAFEIAFSPLERPF